MCAVTLTNSDLVRSRVAYPCISRLVVSLSLNLDKRSVVTGRTVARSVRSICHRIARKLPVLEAKGQLDRVNVVVHRMAPGNTWRL